MKELIIILLVSLCSCNNSSKPIDKRQNNTTRQIDNRNTYHNTKRIDTPLIKESFKEDDLVDNPAINARLKPIRENFKKINSISNDEWSLILKKDIWKSTQGGLVWFYYYNNDLDKIIERNFGETGQEIDEYYLLNGKLSFVLEKSYGYNRPLFYDSTNMKEDNDNQVFDFDKSEITEVRNYFENGKLIHQINSQNGKVSMFRDDSLSLARLEDKKLMMTEFDSLVVLSKQK